jgi:hypothetical protein
MPVIRGQPLKNTLTPERRQLLLDALVNELEGRGSPNGPLIFEIPLDEPDLMDVLVVWQEWDSLRSGDRSSLIREAYTGRPGTIAQDLGVTYKEVVEQHLLPYEVIPKIVRPDVDPVVVRKAMLEEGGITLAEDKVELRFPKLQMAMDAHERLSDKLPNVYWSIVDNGDYMLG